LVGSFVRSLTSAPADRRRAGGRHAGDQHRIGVAVALRRFAPHDRFFLVISGAVFSVAR